MTLVYGFALQAAMDASSTTASRILKVPERRATILFVEDEISLLGEFARVLGRAGHRVLAVSHPEEALRLIGSEPHIDIAIADLQLPMDASGPIGLQEAAGGRQAGLLVRVYYMIGVPGETSETFRSGIESLCAPPVDGLRIAFFTPFPGTPAYRWYEDCLMTSEVPPASGGAS